MREVNEIIKQKLLSLLNGRSISDYAFKRDKELKNIPCSWFTVYQIIHNEKYCIKNHNKASNLLTFLKVEHNMDEFGFVELVKNETK